MSIKKNILLLLFVAAVISTGCGKEPVPAPPQDDEEVQIPESGITDIINEYAEKDISYRGETVSIKFTAHADWMAMIKVVKGEGEGWVRILGASSSGSAKENATVRIAFDENKTSSEREVELWILVEGFDDVLAATLTQAASGVSSDAAINKTLNTYMHNILKEDYLFADAYNDLEVDLTVSYSSFLDNHLLRLGLVNEADGGYHRATHSNPGQRYIYTSLNEIIQTKASETYGLGFGPFLSSSLPDNPDLIALSPSYVRPGSPAYDAGVRRGDMITKVNGAMLTTASYKIYMDILYQNPSGSYVLGFRRFEDDGNGGYVANEYSASVTASAHIYNPVLHASVLSDPDNASVKIGYLVYEAFDLPSQDLLKAAVEEFAAVGITDLILDLRFNVGGAVAQSRWLSGCIAGEENGSKTFTKVIYNDGKEEDWTFDYGYTSETDNLGKPIDLGLDRLFVITSYNTASASELLISSLKGIDFPVKMIGCRTEGKNVGMTVSEVRYQARRFQFAPVTFWVINAKGWGDYHDGMEPDEYVNNENLLTDDDADNVFPYSFGDWGNMDYNIALQWAYCDITGKPRWKETPVKSSSAMLMPQPIDYQSVTLDFERFGNLIYENNETNLIYEEF